MGHITTDQDDPGLGKYDSSGQQEAYLVLSEEERAKGYVRPVRQSYRHLHCQGLTTMGRAIAETYARDPKFYGATFCVKCGVHVRLRDQEGLPQFAWADEYGKPDGSFVGD